MIESAILVLLGYIGVRNEFQIPLYILSISRSWLRTLSIYNFCGMYENKCNSIYADILMNCLPR